MWLLNSVLAYARQDKKDRSRAPITARLIANMYILPYFHPISQSTTADGKVYRIQTAGW
jgi:hypothetical protein